MAYHIITIHQKEDWMNYVSKCVLYDFYHTWYYHSLEPSGEPFLFVYEENDTFIAFPLLRRIIDGTPFKDCTSVYGYSGPISNVDFKDMDQDILTNFKMSFLSFLRQESNISVFSRLHPVINQQILLDQFGGLFDNGRTVAIDLKNPIEVQRSKYRSRYRSKIKQLRNKGYHLKIASSDEEIREFVNIYNANMTRVGAKDYYYFNDEYFFNLLKSTEFECNLLLAYFDDEITSGILLTYSNNIVQFHLAATKADYLHDGPMKVLIDEATLLGRERGMYYLHLGGGLGGEEDSLFEFKSGFSDLFLNFKTWRFMADEASYDSIVEARGLTNYSNTEFFPLYRMAN